MYLYIQTYLHIYILHITYYILILSWFFYFVIQMLWHYLKVLEQKVLACKNQIFFLQQRTVFVVIFYYYFVFLLSMTKNTEMNRIFCSYNCILKFKYNNIQFVHSFLFFDAGPDYGINLIHIKFSETDRFKNCWIYVGFILLCRIDWHENIFK